MSKKKVLSDLLKDLEGAIAAQGVYVLEMNRQLMKSTGSPLPTREQIEKAKEAIRDGKPEIK